MQCVGVGLVVRDRRQARDQLLDRENIMRAIYESGRNNEVQVVASRGPSMFDDQIEVIRLEFQPGAE